MQSIYQKLIVLSNASPATKAAHIDTIQQKYQADSPLCPWCGGTLVLRVSRKGQQSGNRFYGCSNYPKCRYTKNLF